MLKNLALFLIFDMNRSFPNAFTPKELIVAPFKELDLLLGGGQN